MLTTHPTDEDLHAYRRHALTAEYRTSLRDHLDRCDPCWQRWNTHRWNAAHDTPLYRDLQTFLGTDFQEGFDSSRSLARDWDAAAPRSEHDVHTFFRSSTAYLYNLAIWEASGNRPDYLTDALPLLGSARDRTVLDYGCGIGTDSHRLRSLGYDVLSCDFDSPSTRFMRWRQPTPPGGFVEPPHLPNRSFRPAVLWIIDTLDHLPDPHAALGDILATVDIVIAENHRHQRAHGHQRFHHRRSLPEINTLLARYGFHAPEVSDTIYVSYWLRSR